MGRKAVIETKLIRIRIDTYKNLKASKESKETFDTFINKMHSLYTKRILNELEYKNEVRKHYVELLLKTLDEMEMDTN